MVNITFYSMMVKPINVLWYCSQYESQNTEVLTFTPPKELNLYSFIHCNIYIIYQKKRNQLHMFFSRCSIYSWKKENLVYYTLLYLELKFTWENWTYIISYVAIFRVYHLEEDPENVYYVSAILNTNWSSS